MPVDWEALISVEAKLVGAGMASNSYKFFSGRLDRLYSEHETAESDCESIVSPANDSTMTTAQIKQFITDQKDAPFHDIPRLDAKYHDEALPDNELDLWAALISDFRQVATKIPVYTSMMVLNGIPPSLRGKAWTSMAEAHSSTLDSLYDLLAEEWTPFVKIIGRDLNRTFPELTLFQKKGGPGQMTLGRVLRAYSAYDIQVGYCQGLTFLAGPLLLHMDDRQAFCTLVKLMEDYDLRSMFTADMAGLPLRIYQFEQLFKEHLPALHSHFQGLGIGSVYATQWFLSFYAVTCPLDMLMRIYDLMFAEGAIPTMMRVALAVLKRNQTILLNFDDEEQILERLLGSSLWDVYGFDGDQLCSDIADFPSAILARIDSLQREYVTRGRRKAQDVKPHKSKPNAAGSSSAVPARITVNRLASWLSVSTSNTASRGECDSTIAASSEDGDDRRSTVSSSSVSSIASSTATKRTTDDIQSELDKSRIALDLERHERESDKDVIEELLNLIEKPGVISADTKDDDSAQIHTVIAQLRQRLNLTSKSSTASATSASANCKACDRHMMDLASVRAREVMARQEIDMLTDRIALLEAAQTHAPESRPPSPPVVQRRESLLKPLPGQNKRWSILGRP